MKTQILIIGGGFAGVSTAQELEKRGIKTLLVDKKDYFEVTYAVLREVTDPKQTNGDARRYYRDILTGEFVQSAVEELKTTEAKLENGNTIYFDKVILASGSRYPDLPLAKSTHSTSLFTRDSELNDYYEKLQQAATILIIGGGVVGVELAGEIAYAMPNIEITLAHNKDKLLAGFTNKAQHKALEQLQSLGVNIQFNAQYQNSRGKYIDINSGKALNPSLVFKATGTVPNNEYLLQNFSHLLNDKGLIKVDANLAVEGQDNFYAIGDIADVGEAKLGYLAVEQGKYLAKTISKKQQNKKAKPYQRNPFMALVPTGQKTGVVQLPFMVSTWKMLVNLKQKDLFISKTYNGFLR